MLQTFATQLAESLWSSVAILEALENIKSLSSFGGYLAGGYF